MKEFKTLSPTQFGVGDGVKTRFSVARPGDIVRDSNIESVRRVGWQGDQLLRPYPRTNLAIASNDFTNSAWQGSPSLYINFLSGTMPSSVDFSRASTATYVGRDRLIHTAAINEPRFTYDPATGKSEGLLVEGQATNLISPNWYGSTRVETVEMVDSPLPSFNARKVIVMGHNPYSFSSNPTSGPNQVWTHSIYAKPLTGKFIRVGWYGGSERAFEAISAWFDLEKGEITGTNGNVIGCGIDDAGHGWYRCWVSAETVRDGPMGNCVFFDEVTVGDELIWGLPQVEEGTRPTSYIPTEGSQATRIADTPTIPVGDWFNPNEGTFVVEGEAQPRGSGDENTATLLKVGDSLISSNGLVIDRVGETNNYFARTRTSDGGPWTLDLGNSSGIVKIAASYTAGGDMRGVLNGGDVVTGTNVWDGTGDFLYIGAGGLQGAGRALRRANGPISRITYYPRALSNAELQALTS